MIRAYLAGPDVFLPNPHEVARIKKQMCDGYGFEGVFPLDADFPYTPTSKHGLGLLISLTNVQLISSCQVLFANMAPFRGPSLDVGTAFEIGFAQATGLKIFGYTNTTSLFFPRTQAAMLCSGERDPDDFQIEDFDMHDNLMIDGAMLHIAACENPLDIVNLSGFEQCVRKASNYFDLKEYLP